MNQKGALIGIGFSLVLLVLVAADVQLTGSATIIPKYAQASSSVEGGVARHMNPELPDIFTELNIETQNTDEQGLLVRVVPATATVQRYVLLQNKDRLGFFSMTESPDVRANLSAHKEALKQSNSPEMNNLVHVTESTEGHPERLTE